MVTMSRGAADFLLAGMGFSLGALIGIGIAAWVNRRQHRGRP